MIFSPYVYDKAHNAVAVSILPATVHDLRTNTPAIQWQTDWSSEYLTDGSFELYAMKTGDGELVALGAYEILEDSIIVRIAYMESQPESNPTITIDRSERKYSEIGRAMIAFGIKLSVDHRFGGDVIFEAKTSALAEHYERDFQAARLPDFDSNSAPRYLISGKASQAIFSSYLREEERR